MTGVSKTAIEFRQTLIELGASCSDIDHSLNRNSEHSSYFRAGAFGCFANVRISDHECNRQFSMADAFYLQHQATPEAAASLIESLRVSSVKHAEKKEAEKAVRDVYEAPFLAQFKVAPQHKQHDIVLAAYSWMATNKTARQELLARWRNA